MKPVGGDAGQKLEALYAAYFEVQTALAADKKPPPAAAEAMHKAATELGSDATLPEASAKLVQQIAAESEHLHHMDLAGARKAFKPISHAVVTLATQVRSEEAAEFIHALLLPDGSRWGRRLAAAGGELSNPYFGSEMLRCGEKVEVFPPKGKAAVEPEKHDAAQQKNEAA